MATAAKTIDKWKRKKWFKIFAPKIFGEREIGETPSEKPELVAGRSVVMNARTLTGQARKSHIEFIFKITNVQGLNASTQAVGISVKPVTLKRIVRRRNSKIDLVQDALTKDSKKARIKTTVVCLRKIERKKETAIRNKLKEAVEKEAAGKNFEELLYELVFGNSVDNLFKSVKNIAGIKRIEIMGARQLNER